MASMTITTPFIGALVASSSNRSSPNRRMSVVAKAARSLEGVEQEGKSKEVKSIRRDMVFAAAAAAACSAAAACGVAIADEPKPGTPDAKKKYAPICVTMPTASVCHK